MLIVGNELSYFTEDIIKILLAEWHDMLLEWKSRRGNIELPEHFTNGISYASELSLHPK